MPRSDKHPMEPAQCPVCKWTNNGLMNYGTPEAGSKWMCHGCATRALARLESKVAELEASAIRMREYRFALEGIETDGNGNARTKEPV